MNLGAPMRAGDLRLDPTEEAHREPLRAACAEDAEIWEIYPFRFFGEDFDRNFETCLDRSTYVPFVVFRDEDLVGMTSYFGIDHANRSLEIGRTYISPKVRGTGFNGRMKRLMLDRAFQQGFTRVLFKVDVRNARSMAAVRKLGAVQEGVLRKDRITWTGHVRDTALFSILAEEWVELRG